MFLSCFLYLLLRCLISGTCAIEISKQPQSRLGVTTSYKTKYCNVLYSLILRVILVNCLQCWILTLFSLKCNRIRKYVRVFFRNSFHSFISNQNSSLCVYKASEQTLSSFIIVVNFGCLSQSRKWMQTPKTEQFHQRFSCSVFES